MTEPIEKPRSKPLSGLHLLLTYECNYECDHCFVWGGPTQTGTMTLEIIGQIIEQARALGTIEWIYFEGGEPFLYYVLAGVHLARESGFRVGIVSNAYWATSDAEAEKQLQPFADLVEDLSISSDAYHGKEDGIIFPDIARGAARKLGIRCNEALGAVRPVSLGGPASTRARARRPVRQPARLPGHFHWQPVTASVARDYGRLRC
jgi:hypothetical protein